MRGVSSSMMYKLPAASFTVVDNLRNDTIRAVVRYDDMVTSDMSITGAAVHQMRWMLVVSAARVRRRGLVAQFIRRQCRVPRRRWTHHHAGSICNMTQLRTVSLSAFIE